MSVAEFLTWDDGTETRYELVDGQAVALNPPLAPHALMPMELGAAIRNRLPAGCRVYGGAGTIVPGDDRNCWAPDLAVSCVASREHWVEQPRLVVEILSRSTQKHDMTGKLAFYRSFPSIEEILLVRFDQRRCERWQRDGGRWSVEDFIGSAELPLPAPSRPYRSTRSTRPSTSEQEHQRGGLGSKRVRAPSPGSP